MTDPAIEAAQRAWDGFEERTYIPRDDLIRAAAREALKPIRELHRKSPLHRLVLDCDVCSDDDPEVSESHDSFETNDGDWVCANTIDAWCCEHCADLQNGSYNEVHEWPCDTAKLVYTTEELL